MRFQEIVDLMTRLDLGEPGRPRRPRRENLVVLQDTLRRGLEDPDFRLDCIERDLEAWRVWERSGWTGMKPPVATIPELGFFIMMFYWPPGEVSPPHEHTSWTMSAVFHNRLEVATYDWERAVSARRLETRSCFTAEPGKVGFILEPAIHSPRNTTAVGATSFHIYNADDGPVLEAQVGPIEGLASYGTSGDEPLPPRPVALFLDARQRVLRAHAEAAARLPCARSAEVLEALHRGGDPDTRAAVAGAMRVVDPAGGDARVERWRGSSPPEA